MGHTEIEGGMLTGRIEDLQARFNLNNLVLEPKQSGEPTTDDPEPSMKARLPGFQHLLERCQLDPQSAGAILDWMDEDTARSEMNGTEDYEYLGLDLPYRTANAPMVSPSELALVQGFDYEAYACLEPFIATLPIHTTINVNTAPPEILMTLMDGTITERRAEQLLARRETKPYESVEDFLEEANGIGVSASEANKDPSHSISVNSHYYLVVADARIGKIQMRLFSQVERPDSGEVRVLSRGWEGF